MRVLLTGGAGFIGRPTVRHLLERGHEVTVLDSLRPDVHPGGHAPDLPGARLVVGDVRDEELLGQVLPGTDAVVHLAAKVGLGVDLDDIVDYASPNDVGTAAVLRAAPRRRSGTSCWPARWWSTARALRLRRHGPSRPPRAGATTWTRVCSTRAARAATSRWRPGWSARTPRSTPATSTPRPRSHGEHLPALGAGHGGCASRCGSTTSTARHATGHPLRRRGLAVPVAPRGRPGAARLRGRWPAPRLRPRRRRRRRCRRATSTAPTLVALNVGSGTVTTVGGLAAALPRRWAGPSPWSPASTGWVTSGT